MNGLIDKNIKLIIIKFYENTKGRNNTMTLEILQQAMIKAMKGHEKERKNTISSLVSAIKRAAIDKKCKDTITEDLVNEVILKEKKTVQEMIDTCPNSRIDLKTKYVTRLEVINEFAPTLLSDETEIKNMITTLLFNAGIEPLKINKGQIMKTVMPELKGKADMKVANKIIGELLK